MKKFERLALETKRIAHKTEVLVAVVVGLFKGFLFGYYVYSIYIGTIYIRSEMPNPSNDYKLYTTGDLLAVFIALMTGMMMIFSMTPNV